VLTTSNVVATPRFRIDSGANPQVQERVLAK